MKAAAQIYSSGISKLSDHYYVFLRSALHPCIGHYFIHIITVTAQAFRIRVLLMVQHYFESNAPVREIIML